MSDGPFLSGITEVVLRARDLGAMEAFYRDVVGLVVWKRMEGLVFLKVTDLDSPLGESGRHPQLLALVDRGRHPWEWRGRPSGTANPADSGLDHFAFEIPAGRYQAERERLEGYGLDVQTAHFPDMEARALFFKDPEGNVIEFLCHDPNPEDP